MTRITNFGRKRTYVEAGFNNDPLEGDGVNEPSVGNMEATSKESNLTADAPPPKKRKRTKKPKAQAGERDESLKDSVPGGGDEGRDDQTRDKGNVPEKNTVKTKSKKPKVRPNQKDKKSKGVMSAVCPPVI